MIPIHFVNSPRSREIVRRGIRRLAGSFLTNEQAPLPQTPQVQSEPRKPEQHPRQQLVQHGKA
jgi:hypothetical protein